jgi:methionyl aminopeptidase
MAKACEVAGNMLKELHGVIKPGMTTRDVDRWIEDYILRHDQKPAFKGYGGFPACACVSVNEEIIHGIPSKKRVIREGDIVSLDAGLIYQGYHSDAARTWAVGEISPEARKLVDVTQQSFFEGIKLAKAGNHLYDISAAIEAYVTPYGFTCVRDLVGHGIGTSMHEDPQIPNFRQHRRGVKLQAGMTLAIEPMVHMGGWEVRVLDDDWTVVTEDGSLSSHYENTILITDGEPEILSLR